MKHKTKKSAIKRFKVTKKGKVLFRSQGARHLKIKKSQKRLRSLRRMKQLKRKQRIKVLKMIGKI